MTFPAPILLSRRHDSCALKALEATPAETMKIRQRIAERNGKTEGKREGLNTGSTSLPTALTFTFSETHMGCTATVRGPEGKETRRNMRTALKRLLKQIR